MVTKTTAPAKVTLLKDEYAKISKTQYIEQDGFEIIGKTLGIDIYTDVRKDF